MLVLSPTIDRVGHVLTPFLKCWFLFGLVFEFNHFVQSHWQFEDVGWTVWFSLGTLNAKHPFVKQGDTVTACLESQWFILLFMRMWPLGRSVREYIMTVICSACFDISFECRWRLHHVGEGPSRRTLSVDSVAPWAFTLEKALYVSHSTFQIKQTACCLLFSKQICGPHWCVAKSCLCSHILCKRQSSDDDVRAWCEVWLTDGKHV